LWLGAFKSAQADAGGPFFGFLELFELPTSSEETYGGMPNLDSPFLLDIDRLVLTAARVQWFKNMRSYLDRTISALTYDLAAVYGGAAQQLYPARNDVVLFVLRQMDRMPSFLAVGIRAATLAFGSSRLLIEGNVFHRRTASRRRAQLDAWRRSRLGPCRDLMKFYTSLVVLALYSRPESDLGREAAR